MEEAVEVTVLIPLPYFLYIHILHKQIPIYQQVKLFIA